MLHAERSNLEALSTHPGRNLRTFHSALYASGVELPPGAPTVLAPLPPQRGSGHRCSMWWRVDESQSATSPTSGDGPRAISSTHAAGGGGDGSFGSGGSSTHDRSSIEYQLPQKRAQIQQQQQQQHQLYQHQQPQSSEGVGENSSVELSRRNFPSSYQPQQPWPNSAAGQQLHMPQLSARGLSRVQHPHHHHHQQHGQGGFPTNLGATGGPRPENGKFNLGYLAMESTSEYAHTPSTPAVSSTLSTMPEAAVGRLAGNASGAGKPAFTPSTASSFDSNDPALQGSPWNETRKLATLAATGTDSSGLRVNDSDDNVPSKLPPGVAVERSGSRGQWDDRLPTTPSTGNFAGGRTRMSREGGDHGLPRGRLPSVSRLLGKFRARGSPTSAESSSNDDPGIYPSAVWEGRGGGVADGAVRSSAPSELLLPIGGTPLPSQQQSGLTQQQQLQRPTAASPTRHSQLKQQQQQQRYPPHPMAHVFAPGSLLTTEEYVPAVGDWSIPRGYEAGGASAGDMRQPLQSSPETSSKRHRSTVSPGVSLIQTVRTGQGGVGNSSAALRLWQHESTVAPAAGGDVLHRQRRPGGCFAEGCVEPAVTSMLGTSGSLGTKRFCQRHAGLSHAPPTSLSSQPPPSLQQQQQSLPPTQALPPGMGPTDSPPPLRRRFSSTPALNTASRGKAGSTFTRVRSTSGGGVTGARGGGRCEFAGCGTQPRYATSGAARPQFCGLHKLPGQVNIVSRCCKHVGCNKVPHFGNDQERPLFCGEHKLKGMVNVANRRCEDPSCQRQPTYGHVGDKRPRFCSTHKLPEMFDVIARRCEEEGCMTRAAFNFHGQKTVKYCAAHKREGMENLKSKCCEFEGCKKYRVYGFDGEPAVCCASHKREGMVDVRSSRCEFRDCFRHPSFGYTWEKKRRFCGKHKLADMVDVRSRKQPPKPRSRVSGATKERSISDMLIAPSSPMRSSDRRPRSLSAPPAVDETQATLTTARSPPTSIAGSQASGYGGLQYPHPLLGNIPGASGPSGSGHEGLGMHVGGHGPNFGARSRDHFLDMPASMSMGGMTDSHGQDSFGSGGASGSTASAPWASGRRGLPPTRGNPG